jgi:hypothetical protein
MRLRNEGSEFLGDGDCLCVAFGIRLIGTIPDLGEKHDFNGAIR